MAASRPRPFIGINADFTTARQDGRRRSRACRSATWMPLPRPAACPIILPPYTKDVELDPILDRLDGIVFTGGLDLDPRRAGQPTHPAVRADARAPRGQRPPARAGGHRSPHAGAWRSASACRSSTSLCGGRLYLHLPEEQPKALPHYDPTGGRTGTSSCWSRTRASTRSTAAAKCASTAPTTRRSRRSAPKLRVGALSPDGVIEAIERSTRTGSASACSGTPSPTPPRPWTCSSSSASCRRPCWQSRSRLLKMAA